MQYQERLEAKAQEGENSPLLVAERARHPGSLVKAGDAHGDLLDFAGNLPLATLQPPNSNAERNGAFGLLKEDGSAGSEPATSSQVPVSKGDVQRTLNILLHRKAPAPYRNETLPATCPLISGS